MRKNLILLAALICIHHLAHAQDAIYSRFHKINGKVIEINNNIIKYRKYETGPLYMIPIKNIDSVVYENGSVDRFRNKKLQYGNKFVRKEKAMYQGNNFISTGLCVFGNIQSNAGGRPNAWDNPAILLSYATFETNIIKDRIGLAVTPFAGLNHQAFGFALDARVNIKRRGDFRIAVGPKYVLSSQYILETYYDSENNSSISRRYKTTASIVSFNAAMKLHLLKEVWLTHEVGIGGVIGSSNRYKNIPQGWYSSSTGTYAHFNLGIAYRF